ncbi:pyridoxamine 5'-phosphate oxidase family protein [Deferribacterales bacterium RsTz2092]|nr:antibiotic transporter [Deferribacterales bacterium]
MVAMRRAEKRCEDKAELEAFLKRIQHMQIAINTGDAPYVLPINFTYSNNSLLVHSAPVGRKIELLKKSPVVGWTVNEQIAIRQHETDPNRTGTYYNSVIGTAKATFIDDETEKTRHLNTLLEKYTKHKDATFPSEMLSKLVVIRFDIIEMDFKIARQN